MPPGVINSFVPGGANLKYPVTGLNWWTPAGFFRKKGGSRVKRLPLRYARVWLYTWNEDEVFVRVNEEPEGIVTIRDWPGQSWIKIDWKWFQAISFVPIPSRENKVAYLEFISKPEYETDLAFGLFKKLRVTYRPVRTFIKKYRGWLRLLNRMAIPISSLGCYQALAHSEASGDFWFVAGALMAAHACYSMIWMILTVDGHGKK